MDAHDGVLVLGVGRSGGLRVTTRLPVPSGFPWPPGPGDQITLRLDLEAAYHFDATTGLAIRSSLY